MINRIQCCFLLLGTGNVEGPPERHLDGTKLGVNDGFADGIQLGFIVGMRDGVSQSLPVRIPMKTIRSKFFSEIQYQYVNSQKCR